MMLICLVALVGIGVAQAQEAAAPEGLAAAQELFDQGDPGAAVTAFERLVEEAPESAESWFGLGRSRHMTGDPDGALAAFERALELGFNPPRVMFHAARSTADTGDLEATIEWLERLDDSGQKPYLAIAGAEEFDPFRDDPAFLAVVDRLRPCGGEEFRRFDFWIGEWEVVNLTRPDSDAPPALNRITPLHDGCVLREDYQSPSGFTGSSLNFYDARDGLWHQTWIDNQGQALYLSGDLVEGSMVLAGAPGSKPLNRITWPALPEGRVRQLWEVSTDDGESWQTVFDGLYSRVEPVAAGD
jgi:tetratricopeptide (TPR) repeat protein